ncbi:MAG: hypothetical protein R3F59_12470 [Myxococcota bacterium]
MPAWIVAGLLGCNGGDAPDKDLDTAAADPGAGDDDDDDDDGSLVASADCVERLVDLDGVGYTALQDALDAAVAGSELRLCPGLYEGSFVVGEPVRITALEDAATTTLSGAGGAALSVAGGSEITGLTLRDGTDGGLRVLDAAAPVTVTACRIVGNTAERGGGVQVPVGATAVLVDTEVSGNRASRGAGAWVGPDGTLDLTLGSTLRDNAAAEWGGGAWLEGGHLVGGTVSENRVEEEQLVGYDGETASVPGEGWGGTGVAVTGDGDVLATEVTANTGPCAAVSAVRGDVVLQDVSVHDNVGGAGGGIAAVDSTLTLLGTTEVVGNEGTDGGGAFLVVATLNGGTLSGNDAQVGGGILAYGGTIHDVVVTGNTATSGGGVAAVDAVALSDVTIADNVADWGGGLATDDFAYPPEPTRLTGCTLSGNQASTGGGAHVTRELDATDTTFADNGALRGAGLYLQAPASFDGGAIVGNVATAGGGGLQLDDGIVHDARAVVRGTDLGEGAQDNVPSDVLTGDGDHAFGVDATFDCDGVSCG